MKAFVAFFLLILAGCLRISAQECYRVMFYNVENLFDISDDALTQDEEFTPHGKKHWTKDRYVDKLRSGKPSGVGRFDPQDTFGSGEIRYCPSGFSGWSGDRCGFALP